MLRYFESTDPTYLYDYADEDEGLDPTQLEIHEPLLRIKTQADADAYVLQRLTQANKEEIARIYFGMTKRGVKAMKKTATKTVGGGSVGGGTRVYNLLVAADQAHDFGLSTVPWFYQHTFVVGGVLAI